MALRTWQLDTTHTSILFVARHMVVARVHGRFGRFSGTLWMNPEDLATARAEVEIEVESIQTGTPDRDAHLRSPDFLDAAQFPTIAFKSSGFVKGGLYGLQVLGDLSIRGVTKPVTLEARSMGVMNDPWGQPKALFTAKTSINRSDFGILWNKALDNGGWLVSERIELEFDVQAVETVTAAK